MHVHTWADPKMYQIWTVNQTNQNDCPKETQEKCPIKVIQTTLRAWLSNSGTLPLSLPVCLSTHQFSSVQFSRSVVSDSLQPHELQHARPPCLSQTPGVYPNPCPSSRWCHPAISSSIVPFSSFPQSLPASGSFPMSQLFAWGCQSIGVSASASVLPMNTQD